MKAVSVEYEHLKILYRTRDVVRLIFPATVHGGTTSLTLNQLLPKLLKYSNSCARLIATFVVVLKLEALEYIIKSNGEIVYETYSTNT